MSGAENSLKAIDITFRPRLKRFTISRETKSAMDKMLEEVNNVERRFGKKSDQYRNAVKELQQIVHKLVCHPA
jgi:hypothetical protein